MKVSIITVVRNNVRTIDDCIRSVLGQTYPNIEYIVIDGGSVDGTVDMVDRYKNQIARFVCEPDEGIYDALNKGIKLSTGEVIGFLHADDFYANERVVEVVVKNMLSNNVESCYGDLEYVGKNKKYKIVRYWQSCTYRDDIFQEGWMPPHPTFFVRRKVYEEYGTFNTDFKISADYELMLRFLAKHKVSTLYIPDVLVKMTMGGVSNGPLQNVLLKTVEDYRAWKVNALQRRFYTIPWKILHKLPQFVRRRETHTKS